MCEWTDNVALDGTLKVDYDLTAARLAMGLVGKPLFCIFGADGPFYMHAHAAAVVPTTSTVDGSAASFSPNQRWFDSTVTTISLIANGAANVSLSFYKS